MCQRCGVCAKDVPCVDYAIRVGPEEARLEALAVLLEAARLLAVTALVVAAQRVGVRGAWRRVVDLGSERRGVALECLLDSTLAHLVVLWVVVAGLTVAQAKQYWPEAKHSQYSFRQRSDAVAAGCSGGRRAAAGPDVPLAGSTFRRAGSQGRRGEHPGKEGFARKVRG